MGFSSILHFEQQAISSAHGKVQEMTSISGISRVVFVQKGDFRAAFQRIDAGLGETYDAQKYSMDVVERLVPQVTLAAVLCIKAEAPHDEVLPSGVRSIGLDDIWKQKTPIQHVIKRLEVLKPTHLILRSPNHELLTWARHQGIRVLPSFADSFNPRTGLRGGLDRWRLRRLAREINRSSIDHVGNHNLAAAESLAAIGVAPKKIIPWDWPRSPTPADYPPKQAPVTRPKTLICVGTVSEAKGVGDIVRALAIAPRMGDGAILKVVGDGNIDGIRKLALSLGVAERVSFTGRIPHADVTPAMHAADAVLVYSRHEYGEGLPGTIYLGLASRTPLVVSDHPMFTTYFRDGTDVIFAPERDPEMLATRLSGLFEDTDLYERLSRNSEAAFERIVHPVLWGEFVERWMRNTSEDKAWLEAQALSRWRDADQKRNTL